MQIVNPQVEARMFEVARHDDPILGKMEARAKASGFPIIGPLAGLFCYQVARLIGAKRIFELGSGYGYSTLWFAKALRDNGGGEVYHTVWDEALSNDARAYLGEAGLDHLVRFHVGEAVQRLSETEGPFDIIFNDIDKDGYPASLPEIKRKLRPGGALLIDNMLYHGRIFDDQDTRPDVEGVREATRLIISDPDWIPSLQPLSDGVILAIKRG